ncbi:MAG TPA: YqgE/AlgH family protein [Alphaproteobacteria bacterium]|nr:YqgE/AlgH family protein [Alphaproteobacteria bacterium]
MKPSSLTGQLLIAMPTMPDPRFAHSVVYMCTHNETGAMGLIVNRLYGAIDARALFEQLSIPLDPAAQQLRVHYGGPVESGRGFILHSDDYIQDTSMRIDGDVAMTATLDILQAIGQGRGPQKAMLVLGYAGWGAGQLDTEIQAGGWLNAPADTGLLFDEDVDTKWERSIQKLGFSPGLLSTETGHA